MFGSGTFEQKLDIHKHEPEHIYVLENPKLNPLKNLEGLLTRPSVDFDTAEFHCTFGQLIYSEPAVVILTSIFMLLKVQIM